MIFTAQMEQYLFQLIQKYNKKYYTLLDFSEKLNFKNHTKWCKEIQTEIDDRGRLNLIIVAPTTTRDQQWIQSDKLVISWILATLEPIIIDVVLDCTTTAHELWTWIHTFLVPISLPPMNDPIQHEVARRRNIQDKEEEEKSEPKYNQIQNRD